jgi:hypothetical protein
MKMMSVNSLLFLHPQLLPSGTRRRLRLLVIIIPVITLPTITAPLRIGTLHPLIRATPVLTVILMTVLPRTPMILTIVMVDWLMLYPSYPVV